jgi:hypothetical protein
MLSEPSHEALPEVSGGDSGVKTGSLQDLEAGESTHKPFVLGLRQGNLQRSNLLSRARN